MIDLAQPTEDEPAEGDPPSRSAGAGPLRAAVTRLMERGHRAAGAVSAQLVQALTSLLLQVVAVRQLDAAGLGVFALLYSGIVLASSVCTGLVGDSLTVLERDRRPVRGGLQQVAVFTAATGAVLGAVVSSATGLLSWGAAALLGAAGFVFVLEELLRRLLMASMRFWYVSLVDVTCLVVTVAWLLGAHLVGMEVTMTTLLSAVLVAQSCGAVVAIALLDSSERWLAPLTGGDWRGVLRFGGWRAAQQSVRPAMMLAVRTVVIVAVGATLFGELEAARVYAAPAMLVVNGVGGYLFASYASKKDVPLSSIMGLADRGTAVLVGLSLALGAVAVGLLPWTGDLITGGDFTLDSLAVFGWAVYAACSAVLMPYGSLAAVRGRHVTMMGMRVVEAVVSLLLLLLVITVLGADVSWTPYALSIGAVVMGAVVRQRVLLPLSREQEQSPAGDAGSPAPGIRRVS